MPVIHLTKKKSTTNDGKKRWITIFVPVAVVKLEDNEYASFVFFTKIQTRFSNTIYRRIWRIKGSSWNVR